MVAAALTSTGLWGGGPTSSVQHVPLLALESDKYFGCIIIVLQNDVFRKIKVLLTLSVHAHAVPSKAIELQKEIKTNYSEQSHVEPVRYHAVEKDQWCQMKLHVYIYNVHVINQQKHHLGFITDSVPIVRTTVFQIDLLWPLVARLLSVTYIKI